MGWPLSRILHIHHLINPKNSSCLLYACSVPYPGLNTLKYMTCLTPPSNAINKSYFSFYQPRSKVRETNLLCTLEWKLNVDPIPKPVLLAHSCKSSMSLFLNVDVEIQRSQGHATQLIRQLAFSTPGQCEYKVQLFHGWIVEGMLSIQRFLFNHMGFAKTKM